MSSIGPIREQNPCGTHPRPLASPDRRAALRAGVRAVALAATIVVTAPRSADAAAPSPAAATAFIRKTADRMVSVIDGTEDRASRRTQLQTIVDEAVDIQEVARFCLGRYWRRATPAQRQRFVQLFHQVLLDGVTGQISGYRGVRIDLGRATVRGQTTSVQTTVHRPNQATVDADWVVAETAAGLRIQDVVAEAVSMRLTRRSDYGSYLASHHGDIDALIAALQARSAVT